MLTQEWVIVKPVRTGLNISIRTTELTDAESSRFQGIIYFGLFDGKKILNYGFGDRAFELKNKVLPMAEDGIQSTHLQCPTALKCNGLHENIRRERG
ncbi:hypothetical protein TNIN_253231 [Trichonephila inaurata madagascariensis]|uniref:Uncharacterized protein n=1 Tax=Trichonephila inaurata madagascariensis TaxID=2747483 RepID=A0A8X7C4J3_9ARAC|nr:hypothetical protein TNIN_253231 [Trichonephila inaurata madagascariensis]